MAEANRSGQEGEVGHFCSQQPGSQLLRILHQMSMPAVGALCHVGTASPASSPPVLLTAPPACAALQSSFWMPGCRQRCRTTPAEWRCGAWACRPLDPWTTSPTGECAGVGVGGQGGVEGEAPIAGLTRRGPCQLFDFACHACGIAWAVCTAALAPSRPSLNPASSVACYLPHARIEPR